MIKAGTDLMNREELSKITRLMNHPTVRFVDRSHNSLIRHVEHTGPVGKSSAQTFPCFSQL